MPEIDKTKLYCHLCGKRLNYDSWEDCWLCAQGCGAILYPYDMGLKDDPHAGIRHIGKTEPNHG